MGWSRAHNHSPTTIISGIIIENEYTHRTVGPTPKIRPNVTLSGSGIGSSDAQDPSGKVTFAISNVLEIQINEAPKIINARWQGFLYLSTYSIFTYIELSCRMADLIANSHGNESIVISITTGSFLLSKAVCTEEIDRHAARAAWD